MTGVIHSKAHSENSDTHESILNELLDFPALFHLGHYLMNIDFRDASSDAVLQCSAELLSLRSGFPTIFGSQSYEKIPYGSPTRKRISDIIAWTMEKYSMRSLDEEREEAHPDFTMDVLQALTLRCLFNPGGKSPLEG